ncbi:winged helix-turn-helix domain-containing protein (plasmid) [Ensifer adhaerens]|uniref:winged helix-turn-helix domain-containing protein n=1 Tax=Ensifer adhaerens TaxID=106592 RepID=UPI0023A96923|nr:winged helix-turn-helix domain-containing protein [Ensifer adhaerens]WDZ81688.1 winged helix-turn-helix domain-containing protein [Ensifer adhaerens]
MPSIERIAQGAKKVVTVIKDEKLRHRFSALLVTQGYEVHQGNAATMRRLLTTRTFDLLVIDATASSKECLTLCRSVRSISDIALVLIVDSHDDRIVANGLDAGADAYVLRSGKAFDTLARLRSVLRRAGSGSPDQENLRAILFDGWRIDPRKRTLRDPAGHLRKLTSGEFDVLVVLARNPGKALSRRQLLEATRFGLAGPAERSIDVHIARLRKEIEPDPHHPIYVKTVRLGGYVFAQEVELV